MPIIISRELEGNSKLGVWKIEEEEETLLSKLQLSKKELDYINSINSGSRYMHWLSSRVLIREMLGTNKFIELAVDKHGKPHLQNFDYHISISHSSDLAGVLLSKDHEVGMDIEEIHPKISRVAHKFMRREALDSLNYEYEVEQMFIYWCAKESLYKLYGKKQLLFKDNIPIDAFEYKEQGTIIGRIVKKDFEKTYKVKYEKVDNYMMAWVIGK